MTRIDIFDAITGRTLLKVRSPWVANLICATLNRLQPFAHYDWCMGCYWRVI